MIKAEIHGDSHKEMVPTYLRYHLSHGSRRFNMSNNGNMSPDSKQLNWEYSEKDHL